MPITDAPPRAGNLTATAVRQQSSETRHTVPKSRQTKAARTVAVLASATPHFAGRRMATG